jgi:hypothetical protein
MLFSQWGNTALWWAAQGGHKDVAALLLDTGANLDAADKVNVGPAAETWAFQVNCCGVEASSARCGS